MKQIAEHVKEDQPAVLKFLTDGRYVDNILYSVVSIYEAKKLAADTSEVLDRLSLPTKGFSFSGEDPEPQETIDGISIDVNGMKWTTAIDGVEVKIPLLHFGNKRRGRVVGAEFFDIGGDFAKMDSFVNQKNDCIKESKSL